MIKFNWGHKIAIAYLVFVAGIMFLVFKASNERFDLVEKEYYDAELKYQERIDESQRAQALSEPLIIENSGNQLQVQFPKDFDGKSIEGELFLYYPADAKRDVKQNFSINSKTLVLKLPTINRGMHRIKLSWTVDGEKYYYEESLYL